MKAHGIHRQLSRRSLKGTAFGAAERMRCAITTHSTQARDSMAFILIFPDNIEGFMRGLG
jgi:hypothetical protein